MFSDSELSNVHIRAIAPYKPSNNDSHTPTASVESSSFNSESTQHPPLSQMLPIDPPMDVATSQPCSSTCPALDDAPPPHIASQVLDGGCASNSSTNHVPISLSNATAPLVGHPMLTRLKVGVHKPNPKYAALTVFVVPSEPKTISSAMKHKVWHAAMLEELHALAINNTWELVPREPHLNVIRCKWVYRTKLKADGSIERLKARLVAKGFHQEEGKDYVEAFSPVLKPGSLRFVLAVVTVQNWLIRQLDVKNAFLHGDLEVPICMDQSLGFRGSQYPDHICLLHRSLYGLKQAPRAWFDKFSIFLLGYGFMCSAADSSLFTYRVEGNTILLLLYVDDIILTSDNDVLLHHFIKSLGVQFAMKDLGPLHYFLGVEVRRTFEGLFLCQQKYAMDLLTKAQMQNCKSFNTPLAQKESCTYSSLPFTDPTFF